MLHYYSTIFFVGYYTDWAEYFSYHQNNGELRPKSVLLDTSFAYGTLGWCLSWTAAHFCEPPLPRGWVPYWGRRVSRRK
jgi:hypothetical protein